MKITGVKGIVWDLDGTLIDSFGVFEKIIADVAAESGYDLPSREKILLNYHGSLEETIENILDIQSVDEITKAVDKFLEKQEHYYADNLETHLFVDALKLSQQAAKQGVLQIIVTNRSHAGRGSASPKYIVAATSLADSIHEVRPGDEVEYRKPDKRSLGDWLERHSMPPEDIIIIGDQFVDAQLALNVGARSVIIERNGEIPHLDSLTDKNHGSVILVPNLETVEIVKDS